MLPTHLVEMQKYLFKQSIECGTSFPEENRYLSMLNLWLYLYIMSLFFWSIIALT